MSSRTPLPKLSSRNQGVIELVIRYGLLFPLALERILTISSEASRKTLDRLTTSSWLIKHQFPTKVPYFVLSDAACHRLELKRDGRPLRQQALVKRTMVLLHFSSRPSLHLLTSAECREHLQGIYQRGAAQFYLDSESSSLGRLCIDHGRDVYRVFVKARSLAAKQRTVAAVRQLAAEGRFRLQVLTTEQPKAEQLRELFDTRPIHGVPVDVAADPLCISLCYGLNGSHQDV
jgi:hypothetical protein